LTEVARYGVIPKRADSPANPIIGRPDIARAGYVAGCRPMSWEVWTIVVLGLTALSVVRPAWATLLQREERPAAQRRQNLRQAGGGAAMVALAVFLTVQCPLLTGRGYWDLALLALQEPFMLPLPIVWGPVVCWLVLVVLGVLLVYEGARHAWGPREPKNAIWPLYEVVICTGLLWWGAYVPGEWQNAVVVNFSLRAIYVCSIAGGVVWMAAGLSGYGDGTAHPGERSGSEARSWLGRTRRF
jgi:hypothetical protein